MAIQTLAIGPLTNTVDVVMFIIFTGIGWWNSLELIVTVLFTFQRWSGRYFYSLIITACGVLVYEVCVYVLILMPPRTFNIRVTLSALNVGWVCMASGQAFVLWSRVHLVCRSQWKLRSILAMIVVNGLVLHTTVYVAIKGGVLHSQERAFVISEKIAISCFTFQELIISSVYLYETARILRVGEMMNKKQNRINILKLVAAFITIVSIDLTIVGLEIWGPFGVWCSFKGFGYSCKLKIEFAILNLLKHSVKPPGKSGQSGGYGASGSEGIVMSSRKGGKSSKVRVTGLDRKTFEELNDEENIMKTTKITVRTDDGSETDFKSAHGRPNSCNQSDKHILTYEPSHSGSGATK
ncbi:hypothetical protein BDV95DRAFT_498131 [Massariosphaeria phaeospora]|uniref:DUF7703 domain-containing protein n=1 Tax=Massariosphaeria phaeospora TaxID=100035 RepID=A0A7C8M5R4_9PLEO|nr:hypothetical protein BDV95DRAFT_498131 [Massariosphaeria phaeospora]